MAVKELCGDLLKADVDVIVHGCNCFCNFGAGIAKQIKMSYPQVFELDKTTQKGDRTKLGTIGMVVLGDKTFINAYTQYNYGGGRVNVDYKALRSCMKQIAISIPADKKIGMPKIGCGLAGGDWGIVKAIIEEEFKNRDIFIYVI